MCPSIGALQTALRLPEPVEKGELGFGGGGLLEDTCLSQLHARQFPLRDRHLLQIELGGSRFGAPFAFQIVAELVEFLAAFAGEDDGAGAEAVPERVHADSRLTLGSLGSGGLERIATVRVDLMDSCHIVFLTSKANLVCSGQLSAGVTELKAVLLFLGYRGEEVEPGDPGPESRGRWFVLRVIKNLGAGVTGESEQRG
jgi:hypothetical protein